MNAMTVSILVGILGRVSTCEVKRFGFGDPREV